MEITNSRGLPPSGKYPLPYPYPKGTELPVKSVQKKDCTKERRVEESIQYSGVHARAKTPQRSIRRIQEV